MYTPGFVLDSIMAFIFNGPIGMVRNTMSEKGSSNNPALKDETKDLALRGKRQQSAIASLIRRRLEPNADLKDAIQHILVTSAEVLQNGRTSYWQLSEKKDFVECLYLYDRERHLFSRGPKFSTETLPNFFEALASEPAIVTEDPLFDRRTAEFAESYLWPLQILALLDHTVWVDGVMRGFLRFEHLGTPHRWTADEYVFVGQIADIVALTLLVAERNEQDEANKQLLARVQQSEKLSGLASFAGGIAHDFNNLLMGILGNAGLLANELPKDSSARLRLSRIRTAAERAASLTKQLLMYTGKGPVARNALSLEATIRKGEPILRALLSPQTDLQLDLESLPLSIEGDEEQLSQMVVNLVTNSLEAMPLRNGSIRIKLRKSRIRDERIVNTVLNDRLLPGEYALLEVKDDGEGMDQDTLGRMFDPFFSTKFAGRGLGLAAVLGIVRGHRGGIEVSSRKQHGTTIRVYLPLIEPAERRVSGQKDRKTLPQAGQTSAILVVDDEEIALHVTRDMLRKLTYPVLTASSGSEALEIFRHQSEDIQGVFLDLTMPQMDGIDTLKALQEVRPDVPVVLMSGYSQEDISERCRGLGVAGFLQKPYGDKVLVQKIWEMRSYSQSKHAESSTQSDESSSSK